MARERRLTPKQQRFVQEYILDLNATAAALRAGYKSGDVGRQLLTKTHVRAAIAEAKKCRAERCELSADAILRRLDRESRRRGRGSSHSARVQALKLLGQHLGLFPKRLEVTGADGGPMRFDMRDLTDEELNRIIAEGEQAPNDTSPE